MTAVLVVRVVRRRASWDERLTRRVLPEQDRGMHWGAANLANGLELLDD
jgi:hypothetical protein